jgi:hypothetical protein
VDRDNGPEGLAVGHLVLVQVRRDLVLGSALLRLDGLLQDVLEQEVLVLGTPRIYRRMAVLSLPSLREAAIVSLVAALEVTNSGSDWSGHSPCPRHALPVSILGPLVSQSSFRIFGGGDPQQPLAILAAVQEHPLPVRVPPIPPIRAAGLDKTAKLDELPAGRKTEVVASPLSAVEVVDMLGDLAHEVVDRLNYGESFAHHAPSRSSMRALIQASTSDSTHPTALRPMRTGFGNRPSLI